MRTHSECLVHWGTKSPAPLRVSMVRGGDNDSGLLKLASGFTLIQLPVMLTVASYFRDPLFAMYTTNLRNISNTKDMEIEVEDFSASVLYIFTSAVAALFALASRKVALESQMYYTVEALEEMQMWDLNFWAVVLLQHTCMVTFMCSPIDWYFLTLTVMGLTLMLMLLSRLPLIPSGRSRENILMLGSGLLYLMLYSAVRRHGHAGYFVGLLTLDALVLIGHTFDANPDMLVVGNCRLCYTAGMSAMLLVSYTQ
jgi:hypothetical protein